MDDYKQEELHATSEDLAELYRRMYGLIWEGYWDHSQNLMILCSISKTKTTALYNYVYAPCPDFCIEH